MLRYQEQPGLQYTKEIFDLKLIKKMTPSRLVAGSTEQSQQFRFPAAMI
jgi:hypothetical protein